MNARNIAISPDGAVQQVQYNYLELANRRATATMARDVLLAGGVFLMGRSKAMVGLFDEVPVVDLEEVDITKSYPPFEVEVTAIGPVNRTYETLTLAHFGSDTDRRLIRNFTQKWMSEFTSRVVMASVPKRLLMAGVMNTQAFTPVKILIDELAAWHPPQRVSA